MFSFRNIEVIKPTIPEPLKFTPESDPNLFFKIVDDWSQQDFAKNYGGHPRSDVALLEEQQDMSFVEQLLSRLFERSSDGVSDDVSDADLAVSFRSKYCQTASEKIAYYENLLKIRDDKVLAQMEESEREQAAKELAAKRDALRQTLTAEEKEYLRSEARKRAISELND